MKEKPENRLTWTLITEWPVSYEPRVPSEQPVHTTPKDGCKR